MRGYQLIINDSRKKELFMYGEHWTFTPGIETKTEAKAC
jgi:hypothetical protein